ncbi:multidrug efflux SMR transporter [Streptomyces sp. SL13]|uniref:Multidrug efflux SMR transporter n=1 Tax=Streptantibioticus silvisoli TaxID=2705255 RepID=A0AA90HCG9_9ACTN|nr:multidrug efflux SMR transporter [Streptantibioticus silvisoli]MDI5963120.1 multidrug efflux SMR transporter [Streptantibioticus silvisoli]MDI5973190.1 multidrug efflux SMR transporter [Streptantibioticus silvisoli]
MPYVLLAGAIVSEVLATTALKFAEGFTRLWPSLAVIAGYGLSFYLLAQTLRSLEVGTVYAIWSAAGTALIAAIGIAFLHESATPLKMLGIALVIAGVVVINLGSSSP